ncbi:MAG: hypothetical protein CMH54_09485, partial [Myxococcales bacterium]|nr:hypothetical protein [Myxococcales bacterium]
NDGCGNTLDCGNCPFTVGDVGCTNNQCDCPDACATLECGDVYNPLAPVALQLHCNGKCGRCAFGGSCPDWPASQPNGCNCPIPVIEAIFCENRDCGSPCNPGTDIVCGSCSIIEFCNDYGWCDTFTIGPAQP